MRRPASDLRRWHPAPGVSWQPFRARRPVSGAPCPASGVRHGALPSLSDTPRPAPRIMRPVSGAAPASRTRLGVRTCCRRGPPPRLMRQRAPLGLLYSVVPCAVCPARCPASRAPARCPVLPFRRGVLRLALRRSALGCLSGVVSGVSHPGAVSEISCTRAASAACVCLPASGSLYTASGSQCQIAGVSWRVSDSWG